MVHQTPPWLLSGQGTRPQFRWSLQADGPLIDLRLAREAGEILIGDEAGGLTRVDRRGRVAALSRGYHGLRLIATDDLGQQAAAVVGESQLSLLDRTFRPLWSIDLPDVITALDVSPYGGHLAVGLANGKNVIYDARHQRVCHFESERPLQFLRFVSNEPAVIGAAEFGLVSRFDFSGRAVWRAKLLANIGDITSTGDGKRVSVATFTQGVKHLDENGRPDGSYLLEGTPQHLAGTVFPHRLAVATLEGHLYWLDQQGDLAWGAAVPEPLLRICVEPLGDGLICGFQTGRVISLGWN